MIEPQTGNVFFLEKGEVVPNDVVEHAGELTLDKPSGIKLLGRRFTKGTVHLMTTRVAHLVSFSQWNGYLQNLIQKRVKKKTIENESDWMKLMRPELERVSVGKEVANLDKFQFEPPNTTFAPDALAVGPE